ncbi:UNKNOWN [Stylonychia lemnae]|uniref:TLDc domain-containing protein n=1 Tax=Stylonychia lemnae TaxID=5949 RepID=A0A078AQH4_STYLE|nr:UNKNOWN [Stylonychia lemnae]|eukprot:CDW84409.1 UNKNOWN [Stylonychia lemnae]
MFHKTILNFAILLGACTSIQISDVLQKQRSQLKWRQEASNNFNWNATQNIQWSVVNAFIDVQTSPDGDIYAIQRIQSEMETKKYFVYLYNITSNIWTITDATFQAKAIRFDRLGNIYYLDQNNCILNSQKQKLICGAFDFEVTVKREIYLLHDGLGSLPKDTLSSPWRTVGVEDYQYKALSGYKGITLLKDQPILILNDGTVDFNYGGEKLVSISAGIDGSLWALKQEENVKSYQVLKWQTVAQKWYIVSGAKGVSLSAYNEISVAIVDEKGLLSLSSQVGHQDEAQYTNIPATTNPPATTNVPAATVVPTIVPTSPSVAPDIIGQPADSFVPQDAFKLFAQEVKSTYDTNIKSFTKVFNAQKNIKSRIDALAAIYQKDDIFGFIKTSTGSILGFYYHDAVQSFSQNGPQIYTQTMIYGVSTGHFSKQEPNDQYESAFGPYEGNGAMQIITTPRAKIIFYLSCINPMSPPSMAECYSNSNFSQPEYCYWILLRQQGDSNTFECEQIEYYQGDTQ